jgi:hypothetical protein
MDGDGTLAVDDIVVDADAAADVVGTAAGSGPLQIQRPVLMIILRLLRMLDWMLKRVSQI